MRDIESHADNLMNTNRHKLEALAHALEERETLEADEVEAILSNARPGGDLDQAANT